MLKRRQILIIITVAALSFIVGGMLGVVAIDRGNGNGGNPLDRIWEAIFALENQVGSIECGNKSAFLYVPAFDSGWVDTRGGTITFTHNLGTTEVLVYLIGKDMSGTLGIHQFQYGEMYWAYWHNLDSNSIAVTAYSPWDYVRVILWKIQESPA